MSLLCAIGVILASSNVALGDPERGLNDCLEPGLGACCLNGDNCVCHSEIFCQIWGGVWYPGQECEDVVCETNCGGNCSPGETLDCNGNCVPISWIGDGYCDNGAYQHDTNTIYLDCEEFGWDGGDCAQGDVPEEPGACCLGNQTECDRFCEVLYFEDCMAGGGVFLGARTSCLDATCECPPGLIADCNGNCFPLYWMSNEACDEGAGYPINGPDHHSYYVSLGCLELACDAGDCVGLCSGACCLGNECVDFLSVIECAASGGVFLGSGSGCSGVQCSEYLMPVVLSEEIDRAQAGGAQGFFAGQVVGDGGLFALPVAQVISDGQFYPGVDVYDQTGLFMQRLLGAVPSNGMPKIELKNDVLVMVYADHIDTFRLNGVFEFEQTFAIPNVYVRAVSVHNDRLVIAGQDAGDFMPILKEWVFEQGSWVAGQVWRPVGSNVQSLDLDDSIMALSMSSSTHIYKRDGDTWAQVRQINTDGQNIDVAVHGLRVLIGESGGTTYAGGQARVWSYTNGSWVQEATLVPVDNQPGDEFGAAVAIDGDVAAVTATSHSGAAIRGGATVIFELIDGVWTQTQKIYARDAVADMGYGHDVAVTGRSVMSSWYRVENWFDSYIGVQVCSLPLSSWANPEGGVFDDDSNWVPQPPNSETAHIALPAAFDVTASGRLPVDTLRVGTSRPRFQGGAMSLGSAGSGFLHIAGSQSFTGSMTFSQDAVVDGSVVVGETNRPGLLALEPTASLQVTGDLFIDRDAEVRLPLTQSSIPLQVSGQMALEGTLSAVLPEGNEPAIGTTYCLVQASSTAAADKFPVVVLPGVGSDKYVAIEYGTGLRGGLKIIATIASTADLGDLEDAGTDVVAGRAVDIAVADFGSDGGGPDGFDDIALAIPGSPGHIMMLISDGFGGVSSQVMLTVCDDPTGLASGDFDADGQADLVFVSTSQDAVYTLVNAGASPSEMVLSSGTATSDGPVDVAVIRLAGDDEDDIIVACAGGGEVLPDGSLYGQLDIFEHAGGLFGSFGWQDSVQVQGKPGQVKPGSVGSGKGRRRAASTLGGSNELVVISEDTSGVWGEEQRLSVGNDPHDLIMQDLNADGLDDVLVGNRGSNTISVLLGASESSLDSPHIFEVGESPQSLTALDYDNDGDLDIAVRTVDGLDAPAAVSVYRNDQDSGDADLTLALEQTLHSGESVLLLGAGDVDGDSADDLVSVVDGFGIGGVVSSIEIRRVNHTACVGDINNDQVVDVNDILVVIGAFGGPDGDVTGDGTTNIDDLLLCIGQFGLCD